MGEKIVIGPINKGLRNDRTAFVIDNDSFPTLINAYQWRGRIKRKRGTIFLGRLTRFFNSALSSYTGPNPPYFITLVAGSGNLLTGPYQSLGQPNVVLQTNGNIVPGTVQIHDQISGQTYTDANKDGTLQGSGGGTGTINYATGAFTITGGAAHTISASFLYYPDLPVMGLEDLNLTSTQFPGTIAFDTTYSYNISPLNPFPIWDVSFYKNPTPDAVNLPGYVPKTDPTPTTWNGADYQQFWTVNYQGALWATNGIDVPFTGSTIGMQFKPVYGGVGNTNSVIAAGPPAIIQLSVLNHGLEIGDFVFLNEIQGITGVNFQTGYVTTVIDGNNIQVTLPFATIGGVYVSGGIVQYLTNRSDKTKDSLRFYDGDPTDGNPTNPTLVQGHGWVNFAPPISQSSFSIADLPAAQYYLVGARMIVPFKDRLLFFGAVVQSSTSLPIYLQDTVIYSQNGTPYYTASFTGDPTFSTTVFHALLTPIIQTTPLNVMVTATAPAYFSDVTGFGGFITAGTQQPIITVSSNEDVLMVGFSNLQTRLVYSGNDIVPFNFFVINSEFGSASTFSSINLDRGVVSRGSRGFIISGQTSVQRIDEAIPDEVFEINLANNGNERFTAIRDFILEWVYFTYPGTQNDTFKFPNKTLFYNYRDDSWAIFYESYTTYGSFRRQSGLTWATLPFPSWLAWNDPWNSGVNNLFQQDVIAGNQQGFIVFRDTGTFESPSLYITSFSNGTNIVTSPDHNLELGDYVVINGAIGTVQTLVNGFIFSVFNITQNTFQLDPDPGITTETYFGGATITKYYVPLIQTKQFPTAWEMARKTRIGAQQYLLSYTENSQITLLIFLSQNSDTAYNNSPIIPEPGSTNNALIYSTVLYTCPESTNLGLTPANINLQTPTASDQQQIWHRINTSLIGDTVQLGFTISDAQMRNLLISSLPFAITGISQANPAVVTTIAQFDIGSLVTVSGVIGMTELNGNTYQVIDSDATTITIDVDSTFFDSYISGGTVTEIAINNATAEIELHSIIIDCSPSQLLV